MIPIGDKIHVKIIKRPDEKQGLIIVNGKEEHDEPVLTCEVLACGKDVEEVQTGDIVLIPGHAGRWIGKDVINDLDTHRIIYEEDVLAIVEGEILNVSTNGRVHVK